MIIREETPEDIAPVRRIIVESFEQATEADLVDGLRQSGDSVISLVAEEDSEIIGQIAFSKLQAPDRCLALAPVSVHPDRQNKGIGSKLIREGLARAKKAGWQGVFVLGDPAYYTRFGFSAQMADKFETEYPKQYFMALALVPDSLKERSGAVVYAPPFQALG